MLLNPRCRDLAAIVGKEENITGIADIVTPPRPQGIVLQR